MVIRLFSVIRDPVSHITKRVVMRPFPTKDASWDVHRNLQPMPGTLFPNNALLQTYEYLAPDVYDEYVANEKAAVAGSIADGIPDAPVVRDANEIDEPPVDDGTRSSSTSPPPRRNNCRSTTKTNDPDPFANGYEVTPFGRQPITPKPESEGQRRSGQHHRHGDFAAGHRRCAQQR